MLGVHPEADERLAGERLRLRDLVFVMWEHEVHAAGMDVERLAQVLHRHHGALDVPARAALAQWGRPRPARRRFAAFHRTKSRASALSYSSTSTRAPARMPPKLVWRELAVAGEIRDAVIDRAVAHVSIAVVAELLDGRGHFVDVFGRFDDAFRAFEAKLGCVFEEALRIDLGVFGERFVLGRGVADDFVLHVGDIHDVIERVAAVA